MMWEPTMQDCIAPHIPLVEIRDKYGFEGQALLGWDNYGESAYFNIVWTDLMGDVYQWRRFTEKAR